MKKHEIPEDVRSIVEQYKELIKKGVSIKRLADGTGVSYHYFYKMVIEFSEPPFKTEKMKTKARTFLSSKEVKEVLDLKESKLFRK